jgi:hypothetical protein
MGWKHRRRQEPYRRTARDSRSAVHTYHAVDDVHRLAVQGGRCFKCGKITNSFCDKCNIWACENHLEKDRNGLDVCEKCTDSGELNQISF